jgi:hypothetical protein
VVSGDGEPKTRGICELGLRPTDSSFAHSSQRALRQRLNGLATRLSCGLRSRVLINRSKQTSPSRRSSERLSDSESPEWCCCLSEPCRWSCASAIRQGERLTTYKQIPSDLSHVTSTSYVGVASVQQADGTQIAKQILIFPPELRGAERGRPFLQRQRPAPRS